MKGYFLSKLYFHIISESQLFLLSHKLLSYNNDEYNDANNSNNTNNNSNNEYNFYVETLIVREHCILVLAMSVYLHHFLYLHMTHSN